MIRGILFDKDGTLIDFFSLWLAAAKAVVPKFLEENQLPKTYENRVFEAMGVENDKIDPHGGLAYKSYAEIAEDISAAFEENQLEVESVKNQLIKLFENYMSESQAPYVETADVKTILDSLKEKNIYIGLATADTVSSAVNCLKALDVLEKFDYIGADDGKRRPKPEADMFLEFADKFALKPYEIAMVGDTYNDICFAAKNGGTSIGVLSGVSRSVDFHGEADYILDSVEGLPDLIEQI